MYTCIHFYLKYTHIYMYIITESFIISYFVWKDTWKLERIEKTINSTIQRELILLEMVKEQKAPEMVNIWGNIKDNSLCFL